MYFLAKWGCVFVFTDEKMKPGRNETDLFYMTYIISVLKMLFGHGIFAFFAYCMLPCMFPAPCKELSTICSHASLQLNMLLKHVEPHWCPEATISLWSKRGHCCLPGFWLPQVYCLNLSHHLHDSTQATSAHSRPQGIFIQVSSLSKGLKSFKWHQQKADEPEEEPFCDSWESTPSHAMFLSLPSVST